MTKEEKKFLSFCKIGISPVYERFECLKRNAAQITIEQELKKVENWETHYKKAIRCVNECILFEHFSERLSELEKAVFFLKILGNEIKKNSKDFRKLFTESDHYYSEENLEKLFNLLSNRRWVIVGNSKIIDSEAQIMWDLKHGNGDMHGF